MGITRHGYNFKFTYHSSALPSYVNTTISHVLDNSYCNRKSSYVCTHIYICIANNVLACYVVYLYYIYVVQITRNLNGTCMSHACMSFAWHGWCCGHTHVYILNGIHGYTHSVHTCGYVYVIHR